MDESGMQINARKNGVLVLGREKDKGWNLIRDWKSKKKELSYLASK